MSVVDRLRAAAFGTIVGVRTAEPAAALTFDDGPDPETTPRLLDLLRQHGARATFFLIGKRVARYPELVARIAAEGHAIGNHSWDHPALPGLPGAEVADQLRRTTAAIVAACAAAPALMRPPYGDQSFASYLAARRLGLGVVAWSVVGADWSDDKGATIAARILDGLHPGAIVLLHDSLASWGEDRFRDRAPTLAAVEAVLTAKADWRFVTVPELLGQGRARRRWWAQRSDPGYLAGLTLHPDLAQSSPRLT